MTKATGRFVLSTLVGLMVAIPLLFFLKHAVSKGFCNELPAAFAFFVALAVSILIDNRLKKRAEGK